MSTSAKLPYDAVSSMDEGSSSYPPKVTSHLASRSKEWPSPPNMSRETVATEVPLSGPAVPLWMSVTGVSFSICLFLLALAAGFAAYIFANRVFFSSIYLYVDIPNNHILLFSSVISRVPPLLPQVLMGVAAIGFGYDWLVASLRDGHDELTPEQYSLILQMCSTAGLSAALNGLYYRRRTASGKAPTMPPILKRAVIYLVLITIAVNLVGIMDTVLHSGVAQASFGKFSQPPPEPTLAFGRQINQTLCSEEGTDAPCASVYAGAHQPTLVNSVESLSTAGNSSNTNEVVVVDNVALLVAKQRAQNTFTAKTTGWYTSCKPITVQCSVTASSGASTPFACIDYPAFQGDLSSLSTSITINRFNETGTRLVDGYRDAGAWSQPAEYGIIYIISGDPAFVDSQITGGVHPFTAVILWCEANILSVTYHHEPLRDPPFTIQSYELANPNDTFTVTGAYTQGFGNDILASSTGFVLGQNGSSAFAHAFATSFSTTGLALAAGMFEPTLNIRDYPTHITQAGARVNLPILAFYLLSIAALAVLCAYIGVASRRPSQGSGLSNAQGKDVSAVQLAAMRLTTPATLVQQSFPDPHVSRTTTLDPTHLFREDPADPQRLKVGVLNDSATFGVTRRRWGVAEIRGQRVN